MNENSKCNNNFEIVPNETGKQDPAAVYIFHRIPLPQKIGTWMGQVSRFSSLVSKKMINWVVLLPQERMYM